jgi:rhodanese-related sulfurtransferase
MRIVRFAALVLAAAVVSTACSGSDAAEMFVELVAPERAVDVVADGDDDLVVLDVRTPDEFAQARLADAINMDFYAADFRSQLQTLDPEATYLVYCRTGNRSATAVEMMQELGFTRIYEIDGGIAAWYEAGFPIE